MTRGYYPPGLSGTEELLYRALLDNTHVTRETRDIVIRGTVQQTELRHDLMHLSKQAVGLTYRVWQLEEGMKAIRRPPKPEGLSWVFRQAWEKFSGAQIASISVFLLMILLGLSEPKDVQTWLRGVVGLPPISSTQQLGGSSGR